MGYDSITLVKVTALLSKHNSPRDDEHEALADELRERITKIVNEDKYKDIMPMIN